MSPPETTGASAVERVSGSSTRRTAWIRAQRRGLWVASAVVLVVLVVLALAASGASAEVGTDPPIGKAPPGTLQENLLKANGGAPPGGGPSTFSSTKAASLYCYNPVGVTDVQSGVSLYVIGNCANYWYFNRMVCSSSLGCGAGGWDGGFVYGDVQGCGWISGNYLGSTGGTPTPNGCTYQLAMTSFMSYVNCAPHTCQDGSATTMAANCEEYGNYRPWSSNAAVTDPVRSYSSPHTVMWRYLTASGVMAMVRDPSIQPGAANWVFVWAGCISSWPGWTQVQSSWGAG